MHIESGVFQYVLALFQFFLFSLFFFSSWSTGQWKYVKIVNENGFQLMKLAERKRNEFAETRCLPCWQISRMIKRPVPLFPPPLNAKLDRSACPRSLDVRDLLGWCVCTMVMNPCLNIVPELTRACHAWMKRGRQASIGQVAYSL